MIPNVSRLLPVSLEGSLPLTVHLSWGLQISRCACSSVSTPSQCCLLCSVAAWHPQPGSPWGLCPHCESNPKSKSKHLHREWESWVLMHCRGVRTHFPETVWNHEMPGKARAGWGKAWGSGEVEGGRVTHMRKPRALKQEEQALGSALSLHLLRSWWDISVLGTHCPGAQDTCSVLCQAVTPSSAF